MLKLRIFVISTVRVSFELDDIHVLDSRKCSISLGKVLDDKKIKKHLTKKIKRKEN